MLKIVYKGSETQIDQSKYVKMFRDKYIKGFEDEDLFLDAICDMQQAGFVAGIEAARKMSAVAL